MRSTTYEKLENYSGYIGTDQLLRDGFTNRQIANFVEEGLLERVCHGHYWILQPNCEKPKEYKAIEVCMSDSKAMICADSACFYLGLIQEEPEKLSVATSRNDRSAISMNFPVTRHFISDNIFLDSYNKISTDFGDYNISDIDRSVCDCIRFKKDIDTYIFDLVIDSYREQKAQREKRIWEYAKRLNMLDKVQKYVGGERNDG